MRKSEEPKKKKKKKKKSSRTYSEKQKKNDKISSSKNNLITNSSSRIAKKFKSQIFEHEPYNDKDNPIIIIFQNPGLGDSNILIDSNKTIDELISFYFEITKRKDLYGDESIIFLVGGYSIIPPYPKESIETLKNNIANSETINIVVADSDDKMKKIAI